MLCPIVSFTVLKRSRSMNMTPSVHHARARLHDAMVKALVEHGAIGRFVS